MTDTRYDDENAPDTQAFVYRGGFHTLAYRVYRVDPDAIGSDGGFALGKSLGDKAPLPTEAWEVCQVNEIAKHGEFDELGVWFRMKQ